MNIKQTLSFVILMSVLLLTTACFNIEQEVFLNQDGSGQMVMSITLPDLPPDKAGAPLGVAPTKNPLDQLDDFKKEVMAGLPKSVKVTQVKAVQQNGSMGWYAIFDFKNLKDMGLALSNAGNAIGPKEGSTGAKENSKEQSKEPPAPDDFKGNMRWSLNLEKNGDKTLYWGLLTFDSPKPAAVPDKEVKAGEAEKASPDKESPAKESSLQDDLGKQLEPLLMGIIRLRFILHTPAPISESNADIVLRGNTAVWNCTLLGFLKDKGSADGGTHPIEMRASF